MNNKKKYVNFKILLFYIILKASISLMETNFVRKVSFV